MKLSELFDLEKAEDDREITGVSADSRSVREGELFFCLEGTETDGHRYAPDAARRGAAAIVCSREIPEEEGIVYLRVPDTTRELNRVCNVFFGRPSEKMTVFAVTGTNGKSTIASIIKYIYSHHVPTGYIGTIGVSYGTQSRGASLTTPSQTEIHKVLSDMVSAGMGAAAIEASSHGLVQGRMDSVDTDCAVFTQLTHEHLDYHKTMENYLEAKKLLFKNIKKEGTAVLNADDAASIEALKECCNCRYVTYGTDNDADYRAENITLGAKHTQFTLFFKGKCYDVTTNLVARYNVSNILAAAAAACEEGMAMEEIVPLLENIPRIPGRMEVIDEGQDFHVIVDFAHTPDALLKVFSFAGEVLAGSGRIISVFGSAGRRDAAKRPEMGKIAGRFCDRVILTEDDPRDEDPKEIAAEIQSGITGGKCESIFIERRKDAIERAIAEAKKDDIVLILGEGVQPYIFRSGEYREPYIGDDEAARAAIRKHLGNEDI